MLFNTALFSSILLSPVVLAVPSGLGARIARRGESSQGNNRLEKDSFPDPNFGNHIYYEFVDAWLSQLDRGSFTSITGTIIVPSASGPIGSSARIWVALDGASCSDVKLMTGISVTASDKGTSYGAWYDWYPDTASQLFSDSIPLSAGDAVKLTVNASSSTCGTVTIENLTKRQVVSQTLTSSTPLCGQDAMWGVLEPKKDSDGGTYLTVADFGTVTFTNASAFGWHTWFSPSGANTTDIMHTNVRTGETSVTIQYTTEN